MTQLQRQVEGTLPDDFWQIQAQMHPNIYGILRTFGMVASFFLNGHFIVVAGRWVIRVGGYISETSLLFAVLWITGTSIAPDLIKLFMSETMMQRVLWFALIVLAIIPEIILANAIVNAISHWIKVAQHPRSVVAWIWAILFTVPTVLFFILTAITLNTLGAHHGNLVAVSTDTLNWRIDAGWIYGLLELTYAGVKKFMPQQAGISAVPHPLLVPPAQPTPEELALSLVPLLVPHLNEIRASILAEMQSTVPQINYQEIAQSLVPLLPVPAVPEIDHEAIARAVTPLLRPAFVEVRRTIIEEVKSIVVPQVATVQHTPAQIEASTARNDDSDLDRDARLERAYQSLLLDEKKPSANLLYVLANCNRKAAQDWLKVRASGTNDSTYRTHEEVTVPSITIASGTDTEQQSHRDTEANLVAVPPVGTDNQ